MSKVAQSDVVINFSTTNGTAGAADFTAQTAVTYTIPAGSTTVPIPVTILGDLIAEPSEAFTGTISINNVNSQPVTIGTATAICTITDDDTATLAINDMSVNEADGSATFTVTLTGTVQNNFTINYATADNTAVQPSDYTTKSGTLTFGGANSNSQTITVPIINDNIAEATETYYVNLSSLVTNGQAGVTVADAQGLGTILDNDPVTITLTGLTVTEGDSGSAPSNFTATMSGKAQSNVVLAFTTTNGTATATDFTAQTAAAYTITAGTTSVSIPVAVLGDLIAEPQEQFTGTIAITNANAQQVTLATATASATINDNDAVSVAINSPTVAESAGTETFTVTLTGKIQDALTVDFTTANGSALAASDYTAQTGTVTFPAGSLSGATQSIVVTILNDAIAEPTENYTVTLSNLVTTATSKSIATAVGTGTITDDDTATLAINDVSVNEADGKATFTVTLTGTVQNDFTVSYATANNTAVSPSDYTAIGSTSLTFGGAHSNTQSFDVTIINDNIAEATETYFINLSGLNTNSQTGVTVADALGLGTILDNDPVTITLTGLTVTEGDSGSAPSNFTATMSGTAQSDVLLAFTTTNGTATATDFTAQTAAAYTITAGTTSVSIPVAVLGDLIAEPQEQFTGTIAISNANAQSASPPHLLPAPVETAFQPCRGAGFCQRARLRLFLAHHRDRPALALDGGCWGTLCGR